jgi:hypothetical protein
VAAALPYAGLVPPAALGAALVGLIDWRLAAALAGATLAAAGVRASVELVRRARERDWADSWLLGEAHRRPPTAVLQARREELVARRHRRSLARSLRHLVRESRRFALPGASPANYRAVFAHAEHLEALAARLETPAPVSARGVALCLRLLTDSYGPLYDRKKADELGHAADRARRTLDADGR